MSHKTISPLDAENPELSDELIGQTFGVYQIVREIGRGGMGVVYLAERIDGSFRQNVAVKFVKRGMDTDSILKRFRNERQILASLSHSNVALLYDGGTTDRGLPYFVMEYVPGEPLYQFCDNRKLSIKERLKIFVQVCEAIHAAHQIKVVHRDLKPSNILVKADGTPKLLDFGIAKLLDTDLADSTVDPTATQMRMMTPEYASPEQVSGGEITTASDIYSLGVLLYELLSGHRPYRLKNRSPLEIARVICERSPESLSESLTSQNTFLEKSKDQTLEQVLESRGSNLEELRRELSGELEQIVMNALPKQPDDRYRTALEFAEDIRLYLKGKPIKKRFTVSPEKHIFSKPDRKNISLAVLPLKIIGSVQSENTGDEYLSIGLADALITRLSSVERLTIRSTSSVMQFHNQIINPVSAGQSLQVDYVVDGSIRRVGEMIRVSIQLLKVGNETTLWAKNFDEKFTDVLELEDSISEQVTSSLIPHLTITEQAKLSRRETNNPQAYQAYLRGRYFWNQFTPETFPKALESFQKAAELDPDYALAYVGIADFYNWATIFGFYLPREGYTKTREAALRALEIDDQLSEAISVLGFITAFSDFDWAEAERLFKRSLQLNPNYGLAHEWISALYAGIGRDEEALTAILRSLELDPLSLRTVTLTAWTLYQLRHFSEALAKVEEIFEMNPTYYQGFFQRGNILNEIGRAEEAVADAKRGMEIAPGLGYMHYKLCFALVSLNRYEEAWEVLRKFKKMSSAPEIDSYHFAMCYAALDERDLAFEWFNKAIDEGHSWVVWLATDPKLDRLRDDKRFDDLLRRTNRSFLIKKAVVPKSPDTLQTFAVLPFKLNSLATDEDTEEKFLGLGLTDALITRLSKTNQLIVRPTSSVLRFGEAADAFQAGKELDVKFVLDGNIRRIGDRVRVSVQLLDIRQNSTRWAENFDEKFTDILELEDSISAKVAEFIIPKLTGEEQQKISKRGTDNPQAHEAYLRGRYHWNQFTPESLPKALEAFQTAVKLDPEYALAYVGLADFYDWANIYGMIPSREALVEAEKNARRAVELDEFLGEAYATLGLIMQHRKKWSEAIRLKLKAIELNPNYVHAHEWYAAQLVGLGKTEEALRKLSIAEQLDPLSRRTKSMAAWTLYQAHHFEETLKRGRETVELDKNYPQAYLQIGVALWGLGHFEEALSNFRKINELIPNSALSKYFLCFALVAVNRRDDAQKVLEEIKTLAATSYVKPYFLGIAHTALGEFDEAFACFEKSFAEDDPWMLWFGTEPMLKSLHNDPRYADLLSRMNNPLAEKFKKKELDAPKTFAVLPFKFNSLTTDETTGEQFLSIGLADALITRLSKIRNLVIRPTNSVLRFGNQTDAFQAGRKLETAYILDGNIRRVANRIRVSVQLLEVENHSTVWAETFDEDFDDVLELEDSISEKVAKSLIPQLTGEEQKQFNKRGTNSPEAYEAYLRGRFNWNLMTEEGFKKALRFYEQAVQIDPNYAEAYAAIAEFYIFLAVQCVIPFAEASLRAKEAAEKVVATDPTLAEAEVVLGIVAVNLNFDWETAEKHHLKAIEINPNSYMANQWLKTLYLQNGRFDEALKQANRLLELAPDSMITLHFLAWTHHCSHRLEESVAVHQKLIKVEPNYAFGRLSYSWSLRCLGESAEALKQVQKGIELAPENPMYLTALVAAFAANGQREKALETLEKINQLAETRYVSPYMLAIAYCGLGDKNRALDELERASEIRDTWVVWIGVEPQFDLLRDEERFQNLLRKMNHPLAPKITSSSPKITKSTKSVAVLPLQFIGEAQEEDEYLAIGLADAIITRLSGLRRLIVRPTSSVLRFQNQTIDVFQAGHELKVEFIVEGTVRRIGERVRIGTQLLSVKDNSTVWAEKFDEKFTDVLELEDSISEKVVRSIMPQLSGEEEKQLHKRGTNNPNAYDAYLRGRYFVNEFKEDSLLKAIGAYHEAIQFDPNYALPHVGIADFYVWSAIFGAMPCHEAYPKAKEELDYALKVDDSLAEAYALKAFISILYDWDWTEAEYLAKRALSLNPNYYFAHDAYAHILCSQGVFAEAVKEIQIAESLDPLSPRAKLITSCIFYQSRNFNNGAEKAEEATKIQENSPQAFLHFGNSLTHTSRTARAAEVLTASANFWGTSALPKYMLCFALVADGQMVKAREVLEEVLSLAKTSYVKPYFVAMSYVALGEFDSAFEWFEKAIIERDDWMIWFGTDIKLDKLRTDPRYLEILRKTNNPIIFR